MAGRQLDVSVMVRLRDALTSPLAALQRRLSGISAIGARIGAIGGLVAGISFAAPIASAAAFDQKLRDIAVTAGLAGSAAETFISTTSTRYEQLALATGQFSDAVTDGAGQLVAAGMAVERVDALISTMGMTATATSAAFSDVASTTFALSDTLKVGDADMPKALAAMAVASKAGNVEFKDMARYFPSLTAQASNLGLAGVKGATTVAAALEVVRKGAGDSATAANNLKNLLSKALSPDAAKNFKKFGVDIGAAMKDAAAKGMDPFETLMAKIIKITGISQKEIEGAWKKAKDAGLSDAAALEEVKKKVEAIGGAEKVSQLFQDQQVIEALLPLLANIDEYRRIRDEALAATGSLIETDFQTQMRGPQAMLNRFSEIGTQAVRRIGRAFASNLPMINAGLSTLLGWVASIDAAWPGLIDATLSWAGAILMLIAGLAATGPVLSIAAAGVGALGAILGAVLTPIGLVVAALAGGAAIIVANWDEFSGFFSDLWGGITDAFSAGERAVEAFFRGDLTMARAAWQTFASSVGRIGTSLGNILRGVGRQLIGYIDQAGAALIGGEAWGKIRAWATGIYLQARDAIQAGDWIGLGKIALDLLVEGARRSLAVWSAVGGWLINQIKAVDWIGVGSAALALIADGARASLAAWSAVGSWLINQIKAVDWAGLGGELLGLIVGGIKALGAEVAGAAQWMAGFIRDFDWGSVGAALIRLVIAGVKALGAEALSIGTWLKDQILAVDWLSVGVDVINRIWDGMKSIGGAIGGWFQGLLGFGADGGAGAQGAAAGSGASTKITGGLDALTDAITAKTAAPASGSAGSPIAAAASAARAAQKTEVGGTITVQAAPGTSVVSTQSSGPVGLAPADRGRVQGRF